MPKLIRLYIDSVLVGLALAIGFMALLVLLDVAQLGRLVLGSDDGIVAALMIVVFFGGLFSSVQFALRVVLLDVAHDRREDRRRRHGRGRRHDGRDGE